jgi:hypothetical protein
MESLLTLSPIEQEIIATAVKEQDVETLVHYPYLYKKLRNAIPPVIYSTALLNEATIASFNEYILLKRNRADLKVLVAKARSNLQSDLLNHLIKLYGQDKINLYR